MAGRMARVKRESGGELIRESSLRASVLRVNFPYFDWKCDVVATNAVALGRFAAVDSLAQVQLRLPAVTR